MIKQVGFDLDNTLYKADKDTYQIVRAYVADRAAEYLNQDPKVIREKFEEIYSRLSSGSLTLVELGVPTHAEAKRIMREGIDHTDYMTIEQLSPDEKLAGMLERIASKRGLFLITTSSEKSAKGKFKALGVNPEIFGITLYGESPLLRNDGSAFEYVSQKTGASYSEMMFVGDREKVDILPARECGLLTAIVNATSQYATYNLPSIYDLENVLALTLPEP